MELPFELEQRLSQLVQLLQQHQLDAYVISTIDEHLNEYVPNYKQRLLAISGFSGSLARLVLRPKGKHQLFVDSRYYVQAETETTASNFEVQKLGMKGVPSVERWLAQEEQRIGKLRLGFDPFVLAPQTYHQYRKHLTDPQSEMVPISPNLIDLVWKDRPEAPRRPIYELEVVYAGESVESKLTRVRAAMSKQGVKALILTKLDEIAWLTNLRGSDVECNPVFEAYCVVEPDKTTCFTMVDPPGSVSATLHPLVQFAPYSTYSQYLNTLAQQSDAKFWLDAGNSTMGTSLTIQQHYPKKEDFQQVIFEKENPIVLFKALKNAVEVRQIRQVHHRSAGAKIRSFVRLYDLLVQGQSISEKRFSDLLYEEYSSEPGFADLSFPSIVGFAENGAIVHYSNPSDEKVFEPGHLLLIDSGVQLLGGTTDDTRTLIIGEPSQQHIQRYTLVLQAHIRLALQKFPIHTKGSVLDAITRAPLWNAGLDYGHGTGHGVGAFLNVHEGPHGISSRSTQAGLQPGMVVSNEPGFYEVGWGGIRLENLYVVTPADDIPPHQDGRTWCQFDPLTLIPFERKLVDSSFLSSEEYQWLQDYHQRVWQEISPYLEGRYREWLETACQW